MQLLEALKKIDGGKSHFFLLFFGPKLIYNIIYNL
jgi:hypothetical protein